MNIYKRLVFWLIIFSTLTSFTAEAVMTYTGKKIVRLYGFYDSADCIYFDLEGVSEADPIVPNRPTFAIARSQAGSKEAYAALLSAKLTNITPIVVTRGNIVCGYAGVAQVVLP